MGRWTGRSSSACCSATGCSSARCNAPGCFATGTCHARRQSPAVGCQRTARACNAATRRATEIASWRRAAAAGIAAAAGTARIVRSTIRKDSTRVGPAAARSATERRAATAGTARVVASAVASVGLRVDDFIWVEVSD